jgi:UDP:flavonoid glycosyltransferase YjiC (YdhE family)
VNISVRVFQTLFAFSGNAPPQLAVTCELVARGHEVRVLAHSAARKRIERTGAEFFEFQQAVPALDITRRDSDSLRDWEARTRAGAGMRLIKNGLFAFVVDVSRECAEMLADWPADVVVFDWMLTGAAIAADGADVPAVALVHCPYPLPVDGAPPLFTGLRPLDGPLGAMRDRVLNGITHRMLRPGLPLVNKARSEQGLAPLDRWVAQLLSVREIAVLSAPELDFSTRGALPANVRYVGPAFEPHNGEWRSPWPETNIDPLVVASFSTSYMDQQALAQRVLDALAGLPVRALLTAGPALDARAAHPRHRACRRLRPPPRGVPARGACDHALRLADGQRRARRRGPARVRPRRARPARQRRARGSLWGWRSSSQERLAGEAQACDRCRAGEPGAGAGGSGDG